MQHSVQKIASRSLSDDGQAVTLTLTDDHDKNVTLNLPHTLANELRDTITALNDEAMARQVPQAEGMRAGAYRRCHKANLNVDATSTAILIEFDPDTPLRMGVAYSIDDAQALAEGIENLVKKARDLERSQTRQ